MSNTIRETVTAALPAGTPTSYASYVDSVVQALEAREREGLAIVVNEVTSRFNVSAAQAWERLYSLGLAERPAPEPEPEPEPEPVVVPTDERIAALEATVARLTRLAQDRLGITV